MNRDKISRPLSTFSIVGVDTMEWEVIHEISQALFPDWYRQISSFMHLDLEKEELQQFEVTR